MAFFGNLNFSSSNEDGRTELAALGHHPRRLLCLTGSGTRALDMLLSGAEEVIALDLNPMQNQLLRLKVAAFETLDHAELLAYLGLHACGDRAALHDRVRMALPESARCFWDQHRRLALHGVWYQGLWERLLRVGAFGLHAMRGRKIEDLFAAGSLAEQARLWRSGFDDRLWRAAIRLLGRRWLWTRVIGEPGGAFLPGPDQVEARLSEAFQRAAGSFFFRDSDFASLILRGRHNHPEAVPLHLQAPAFDRIRDGLARLRVVDGGLCDLNTHGLGTFDAFSLSDFGSYCDQAAYDSCWDGILSVAAQGATFCERTFMNPLPHRSQNIVPDSALSRRLTMSDRAIIYDIRAGRLCA